MYVPSQPPLPYFFSSSASRYCLICLVGVFLLAAANQAWGQTTFIVKRLSANTPDFTKIYLSGNFNDWDPASPSYELTRSNDGTYQLTLADLQGPIAFKVTRGSWDKVESDANGQAIPNRRIDQVQLPRQVQVEIRGWEDIPEIRPKDSLELRVVSIPDNTPKDAALYVTGNFNSWVTDESNYRLRLQPDSSFSVRIPVYHDTLEYKFTRGNWSSVEGRMSGRARFNRQVNMRNWQGEPILVEIASWEDLAGTPVNAYTIFWLMAAIQGLLIIVAIVTLDHSNLPANRLLVGLLLIISLALISRVAIYDRDIFNWSPKLLLVPDLIYFLYAPVFASYIRRLLHPSPPQPTIRDWLPFIPFVLHILAYAPLFFMQSDMFINKAVTLQLRPYFLWTAGLALPYNVGYWWYSRRIIRAYQHESDHQYSAGSNLDFLRQVMGIKAACLILWLLAFIVGGYGSLTGTDTTLITDRTTDVLWIGFSLTVFLLGYYAMKEPDIFRIPTASPEPELAPSSDLSHPLPNSNGEEEQVESPYTEPLPTEPPFDEALKERIATLMASDHPYLNPKLTLSELADLASTNPHELSRAINQGFGMNFNDFVNTYRVESFKQRVVEPRYQNHTFLAVAMMVGFNSKTAFNRSFKKLTGQTPREYFKAMVDQ